MTATAPQTLKVAEGISFGIDYVTKVCAILAQRRKGKTYCAAVIAEELYAAGQPWVALDPTGAWWGLRSSADGERPGIPVVVIGGQHGDLPLEAGAGAFIADLVLDYPGWYVIDLSLLEGRVAEREFATAFANRLHRRKMQPGMDFPLHLFVDEADLFLPQEKETKADVPLLAAYQGIVRRGGLHGLGVTIISQRPALVNKNALTQLDLLILLRLVAGNDQDAVDKNYVARATTKDERAAIMGSLASLPVGTAVFFEPGAEPKLLETAKVRERRTFNSSATPKPGEQRIEPRVFAEVDLEEISAQMQDAVERAKENDPAELRKSYAAQIAELQRVADEERRRADAAFRDAVLNEPGNAEALPGWVGWFRTRGWLPPEEQPEPERVEIPVASIEDLDSIWKLVGETKGVADSLVERLHTVAQPLAAAILQAVAAAEAKTPPAPAPAVVHAEPDRSAAGIVADTRKEARARREATAPEPPPVELSDFRISGPQQKILDALAWFATVGIPAPRRPALAGVAGVRASGGGFRANISTLSSAGLICYPEQGRVALTSAGRARATFPAATPTESALQDAVCATVSGPQAAILRVLISRYPNPITREDLAAALGLEPTGGGFRANVSTLSGLELIVYPQKGQVAAAPLLFFQDRAA